MTANKSDQHTEALRSYFYYSEKKTMVSMVSPVMSVNLKTLSELSKVHLNNDTG